MKDFMMTIGGERVSGSTRFEVLNPSTEDTVGHAPTCTREQLDRAMAAAGDAFGAWRRDEGARREAMLAAATAIAGASEELGMLLSCEQGKPLAAAIREVRGAAYWMTATAALELPVERVQDDARTHIEVRRRPLGVVAAITPWNYPVLLAMWKIAPALLTGNTVVLKPSPYTPLSTLALGEVLREVFPPGVLNVISGGDDLGAKMTAHPAVRKISFTGSVATGKKVMAAAAPDLKRITLELGGNDAAIVLDDVDPARIAKDLFWGAFDNSGQVCSAIKRLYVHGAVAEPLVEALAELARTTKMGDGLEEGVRLGPLNNRPQLERVCGLLDRARADDAQVVAGGERIGERGYFLQATLLTDVDDHAAIVADEQFGPVLPILTFTDEADVLERANGTRFGLSGSVWSGSEDRAMELGAELDCGTVWINQHLSIPINAPFGGFKHSGLGREHGRWGLEAYTEPQTFNVAKPTAP